MNINSADEDLRPASGGDASEPLISSVNAPSTNPFDGDGAQRAVSFSPHDVVHDDAHSDDGKDDHSDHENDPKWRKYRRIWIGIVIVFVIVIPLTVGLVVFFPRTVTLTESAFTITSIRLNQDSSPVMIDITTSSEFLVTNPNFVTLELTAVRMSANLVCSPGVSTDPEHPCNTFESRGMEVAVVEDLDLSLAFLARTRMLPANISAETQATTEITDEDTFNQMFDTTCQSTGQFRIAFRGFGEISYLMQAGVEIQIHNIERTIECEDADGRRLEQPDEAVVEDLPPRVPIFARPRQRDLVREKRRPPVRFRGSLQQSAD